MEKSTTQLYPLIVSPYLALGSLSSWPTSLAKVGEFRHIQAFLISSHAPSFLFRLLFSTPSSVLLRFSPPPPPEKTLLRFRSRKKKSKGQRHSHTRRWRKTRIERRSTARTVKQCLVMFGSLP